MCTSNASKPARSNAAAISIWPLTPCSRRIATRGRAPFAMNGAATSSLRIERELRREARIARIEHAVVFLLRAVRVVAQPLHAIASSADHARCSSHARLREQHLRRRRRCAGVVRVVRPCRSRARSAPRPAPSNAARTHRHVRRAHLQHRAELFVEQRGERRPLADSRMSSPPSTPHVARERHLAQRDEQGRRRSGRDRRAACRRAFSALDRVEEALRARPASSTSGARCPMLPYTCASTEPPRRLLAAAEVDQHQRGVAAIGAQLRRQRAAHVRAPARTPRRSATAARSLPCAAPSVAPGGPHRQRILADRDADAERRAQLHARPRCTVSYSAASSPGWPAAAIQFADSLTSPISRDRRGGDVGDRLADRHAARRRRDRSARAACARPSPSLRRA